MPLSLSGLVDRNSRGPASGNAGIKPRSGKEPTDGELLERFAREQDEGAFEALVRRHGARVLAVCRRLLRQEQDAEDASQATFLVLMRKAGSLNNPQLLGNWLYGVASRIARKTRSQVTRQSEIEREAPPPEPPPDPVQEVVRQELHLVLNKELSHLPSKYRTPLILCHLEGLTNKQAAQRLGWPAGSMSYILAHGRQLLRERLTDAAPDSQETSVAS
jgi:RNA polymerase sigma-70 factor (ECF subfamily)